MAKRWIMMKSRHGEPEEHALQVYSDKFSEYDKVSYLVGWLNRHNANWSYWLREVEVEKNGRYSFLASDG